MPSVLQNFPFVPQNQEQAKTQRDRRDAQVYLEKLGKKCNHIGIRLIDSYDPAWREKIGPLKCLRVLRHRIGVGGNKVEVSVKVKDGYEYFDWDNQIGQHVAWLYDDEDGYNRSLLASLFFERLHEIMDPEIRKEIEIAAIEKKKNIVSPQDAQVDKPLTSEEIKNISVESIDEQIEMLKKQRKAVISVKESKPEPQKQARDPRKSPVLA